MVFGSEDLIFLVASQADRVTANILFGAALAQVAAQAANSLFAKICCIYELQFALEWRRDLLKLVFWNRVQILLIFNRSCIDPLT